MPLELFTSEAPVEALACGSEHCALVLSSGEVYTWGRSTGGRLGLGETRTPKVEAPTRVNLIGHERIRGVACGNTATVCVTERGQVISWGRDNAKLRGSLESLDPSERGAPYQTALPWKPYYVRIPVRVRSVHCGWEFTVALTENSSLLGWGENNKGQLGFETTGPVRRPTTIQVADLNEYEGDDRHVATVSCGASHACVVDSEGSLYSWGDNEFGQAGQGHWDPIAVPGRVLGEIEGLRVRGVACGLHTLAIAGPDASLYTWGSGTRGQLGHGTESDVNAPRRVASVPGPFAEVHCGEYHSLAVDSRGNAYTWGSNIFGELTRGSRGSLRKVACYTEPQLRGRNLAEGSESAGGGGGGGGNHRRDKFGCGGVTTLVVRMEEEGCSPRRGVPVRRRADQAEGAPRAAQGAAAARIRALSASRQRAEESSPRRLGSSTPFRESPEAVIFPVPPAGECRTSLALREIKEKRHRNALQMYRRAKSDVVRRTSAARGGTPEGGSSLETIFNGITVTPASGSVEKAAGHVQEASMSIAKAALALGEGDRAEGRALTQSERREILQVSAEIRRHIERYHGKTVEMPSTPRRGEDEDAYYEAVASQAHAAASRILQQMRGMRLIYEDLSAVSHSMESDDPDKVILDFLAKSDGGLAAL